MKILTAEQMRAVDRESIEQFGLPSLTLMENAGRQVVGVMIDRYGSELQRGVCVICGSGNNGGDGYVIARTCANLGFPVVVLATRALDKLQGDAGAQARLAFAAGVRIVETAAASFDKILAETLRVCRGVVVDALLGTGFQGKLKPDLAAVIRSVQHQAKDQNVPIVAVDLPSGLSNEEEADFSAVISADLTVTFQTLKFEHVFFPATQYCGDVVVVDIGLAQRAPTLALSDCELLDEFAVTNMLSSICLPVTAHKGTRGHVVVIGGAKGYFGAVHLSTLAAAKCGAGLVTALVPQGGAASLTVEGPEIMVRGVAQAEDGSFAVSAGIEISKLLDGKTSFVLGPGIAHSDGSRAVVKSVLEFSAAHELPGVIDADALNIIASDSELRAFLRPWHVCTPHPGEMGRLMSLPSEAVNGRRYAVARQFSQSQSCVTVLKGARTIITEPSGKTWVNPTACSALATGGSGDVLSGVIAALVANGLSPASAACVGVFIHGGAGEDLFRRQGGFCGITASDIIGRCAEISNRLRASETLEPSFVLSFLPAAIGERN